MATETIDSQDMTLAQYLAHEAKFIVVLAAIILPCMVMVSVTVSAATNHTSISAEFAKLVRQ